MAQANQLDLRWLRAIKAVRSARKGAAKGQGEVIRLKIDGYQPTMPQGRPAGSLAQE